MNRPNFENYKWKYATQWKYDVVGYRANVEKYCDELEKALDKACNELVNMKTCVDCYEYKESGCPFANKCKIGTNYCRNKKQWKEWLMKDE